METCRKQPFIPPLTAAPIPPLSLTISRRQSKTNLPPHLPSRGGGSTRSVPRQFTRCGSPFGRVSTLQAPAAAAAAAAAAGFLSYQERYAERRYGPVQLGDARGRGKSGRGGWEGDLSTPLFADAGIQASFTVGEDRRGLQAYNC